MIPEELRKIPLRPLRHIVILGAGASSAATPEGEANKLKMPLMKNLPDVLYLKNILTKNQFKQAKCNFEIFYTKLVLKKHTSLQKEIDNRVFLYFNTVKISGQVTLYDRLVLSLRKKDVIATFNWDPLLPYAYRRNGIVNTLPHLLFLHGNVKRGVCMDCKQLGWNDDKCLKCGKPLERTSLLYPVTQKNYSKDHIINEDWKMLDWYINNAYFITIFGYSAPRTDIDARRRIIDKLSSNRLKNFLQLEIIDINAEKLAKGNLCGVVAEKHFGCYNLFEHSWLSQHPRLTCEALFQATMMCSPIKPYMQPNTNNLSELQEWAKEFHDFYPDFIQEGFKWQG